METDKEYRLYLKLKTSLIDSFQAFREYQRVALPLWQKSGLNYVGAKGFPGWREYVETTALPLNRITFGVIQELSVLLSPEDLPLALYPFINYHIQFESRYAEWKRGENPKYEFISGYWLYGNFIGTNFPEGIEEFVDNRIAELLYDVSYIEPKIKENIMSRISFLGGLTLGAIAATLVNRYLQPEPLDEAFDSYESEFSFAVGEVAENITEDDVNDAGEGSSEPLIDSLRDIVVPGSQATLLKVRVLYVERAKAVAMWGTKGLEGDEPTTFRRLTDLSTEHLINIRDKSSRVTEDEIRIINSILEDRVAAGEADESVIEE